MVREPYFRTEVTYNVNEVRRFITRVTVGIGATYKGFGLSLTAGEWDIYSISTYDRHNTYLCTEYIHSVYEIWTTSSGGYKEIYVGQNKVMVYDLVKSREVLSDLGVQYEGVWIGKVVS